VLRISSSFDVEGADAASATRRALSQQGAQALGCRRTRQFQRQGQSIEAVQLLDCGG
jgi:hypothetical protein